LICIEEYTGFKYKGSDNRGEQGGAEVQRRWGEHGVQVEEGECKRNTKGGNDRIGIVRRGRFRGIEKGSEGKTRTGLNS